ncbi:MAG: S24/S26 family peptidase [Cyclobacteriaceae bacterium]
MIKGTFETNITKIEPAELKEAPQLITAFTGGHGIDAMDGMEQSQFTESKLFDTEEKVIITVTGDSMEPEIKAGDRLIVETKPKNLKRGDIVVACYNCEYVVKIYDPGAHCLYLSSFNPEHEPIRVYDDDDVEIVGRALEILRLLVK